MHKFLRLIGVTLMLMTLGLSFNAQPVDAATEAAPFADQMPADSIVYAGIRTDDAYIDLLDSIAARFIPIIESIIAVDGDMDSDLPELSLRALIDMIALDAFGSDFSSTIRPWLGNFAAMSVISDKDGFSQVLVAIDITDKAALLDFLNTYADGLQDFGMTEEGDFTIFYDGFSSYIAISNETMYITSQRDLIPFVPLDGSLATAPTFSSAIDALPAKGYNIFFYADGAGIAEAEAAASAFGTPDISELAGQNATIAVGATIEDDRSMILDVVSIGGEGSMLFSAFDTAVDPAFNQYIPATASMVVHGTNFADVFTTGIELSGEDPAQFETLAQLFQLDFQSEFLPLFSGDYALFLDLSAFDVMALADATAFDPSQIQAGLILETTNFENTQAVLSNLNMLMMMLASGEGITVTPATVADADALIITIDDPTFSAPLEIVIAANEEVIVIATREAAITALTGAGGLDTAALYQEASNYFVENPSIIAYMDQGGISTAISLFGLVVMGPAIGNVYENIIDDLGSGVVTPGLRQGEDDMMTVFFDLLSQFNSMTITTSVNGDVATARFVITLSE